MATAGVVRRKPSFLVCGQLLTCQQLLISLVSLLYATQQVNPYMTSTGHIVLHIDTSAGKVRR